MVSQCIRNVSQTISVAGEDLLEGRRERGVVPGPQDALLGVAGHLVRALQAPR